MDLAESCTGSIVRPRYQSRRALGSTLRGLRGLHPTTATTVFKHLDRETSGLRFLATSKNVPGDSNVAPFGIWSVFLLRIVIYHRKRNYIGVSRYLLSATGSFPSRDLRIQRSAAAMLQVRSMPSITRKVLSRVVSHARYTPPAGQNRSNAAPTKKCGSFDWKLCNYGKITASCLLL